VTPKQITILRSLRLCATVPAQKYLNARYFDYFLFFTLLHLFHLLPLLPRDAISIDAYFLPKNQTARCAI